MLKKIFSLLCVFALFAAPLGADDSLSYIGKVSSGGTERVGFIAFEVSTADGTIIQAYSNETTLTTQAEQSLEIVPAWVRADLRDAYSRVDAELQDIMAGLLLGIDDPRIIDEVAFTFARLGPETIDHSKDYLETAVENAAWIYLVDEDLDYVEIVDVGNPAADDDFYTTTRYTVLDGGTETSYTLPQDVYYWYVVHPILDCQEWLRKLYPPTGFSTVEGEWWRSFYYEDNEEGHYTRPAVLTAPNDITDSELASYDFGDAAAYSFLVGPERSYSGVVRQAGSRSTVFMAFVHGDGRCCNSSYPNPDGQVFVTTMPVEAAAANGSGDLLENMLLAGQGNRELRTNLLLSEYLDDTAPRKILILKDRNPFDAAEDFNETLLVRLGRDYDVLTSADLAALELTTTEPPYMPSEYIKIVVPSDQPFSLYQALSDNAAKIEEFVDHGGVLQFHAATRPADDWTALVMPFGIEALSMDGSNYTDDIEIAGFPLLKEVIENTTYLWDRERVVLPGERAYDPSEGAIAKIGWWVANNHPWRVIEMATWRRNPTIQRAVDPARILFNHFANCGEIQDVYGAAMRTLLIPCSLTATHADDHVWNEFYENDGWYPLQVSWSGSSTHIDEWSVAYDADTGGGKTISGMIVTRPDCYIHNVLGRYEPEVDGDGIIQSGDYSYYVTLRITVVDRNNYPVDGARIFIATPAFYDPSSLGVATWAFTGPDGVAEFNVGENNDYYYQVESVIGTVPDEDHVDLLVRETETTEPGEVIERSIKLEGVDSSGLPFPPIPSISVSEDTHSPPGMLEDAWTLRVGVAGDRELAYGASLIMNERSWMEPAGSGSVSVFLMDADNYRLFLDGYGAGGVKVAEDVLEYNFDIDLLPDSGTWYLVVAGPDRVVNAREISLDIETFFRAAVEEEGWPDEGIPDVWVDGEEQPEAETDGDGPEEGNGEGCGCRMAL